ERDGGNGRSGGREGGRGYTRRRNRQEKKGCGREHSGMTGWRRMEAREDRGNAMVDTPENNIRGEEGRGGRSRQTCRRENKRAAEAIDRRVAGDVARAKVADSVAVGVRKRRRIGSKIAKWKRTVILATAAVDQPHACWKAVVV
ncbi:hypothetical protein, partial [Burkholderia cenocepacia]|uniref:hypothetical protein n=1 Tax=Burkholderia cenocepacia TaxID=95486 RepID=UPI00406BE6D8